MAWSKCPYHHFHYYPSPFDRPQQRLFNNTAADQLFGGSVDSIFEFPSRWLDEMLGGQEQHQRSNGGDASEEHGQTNKIVSDKEKFKVALDVHGFKPEELSVTCVKDRFLIVQGKQQQELEQEVEEEEGNMKGYVTREFRRSYLLPNGVDPTKVKSNLSPDGRVLCLEAPKKTEQAMIRNERVIPIER